MWPTLGRDPEVELEPAEEQGPLDVGLHDSNRSRCIQTANFTGLVLGCIEANFCKKILVGKLSPRSTQCTVSKPIFASKYSLDLETSRRDLHNARLCTVLKTQIFVSKSQNFVAKFCNFFANFAKLVDIS